MKLAEMARMIESTHDMLERVRKRMETRSDDLNELAFRWHISSQLKHPILFSDHFVRF